MKNYTIIFAKTFSKRMRLFLVILAFSLLMPELIMTQSLATVNLGSSGNFAILSKTGISTSGATSIVGNIGISPAAATYMTGFGLIMDPSGTFSTSSLISGQIYASDYTYPTPASMITAIADMEIANSDAASRKSPDFTELYAGDLTGQTLMPGLYKWGTNVLISAGGLTISGSSSDIWIFQIAQNLDLANGAAVTLIGGAQASNIFWQVAGQVTIGTTAAMQGIILCETQIVLNTSATLVGRALAQTAVTLDANSITTSGLTAIEDENNIPFEFALIQNYPNPFNPSTVIKFTLPENGVVILSVYDTIGNEIKELVNGVKEAGTYLVTFDGASLTSGIYFYRINFNGQVITNKMMLVK